MLPFRFRPVETPSLLSCAVIFAAKVLETKDGGGGTPEELGFIATCEVMLPCRTQQLLCV
jgi:hypothetical protein